MSTPTRYICAYIFIYLEPTPNQKSCHFQFFLHEFSRSKYAESKTDFILVVYTINLLNDAHAIIILACTIFNAVLNLVAIYSDVRGY